MQGYGRDESAPTPGGVFVTHFVGERNIINNPSVALSQTVSSRREPIYRAHIYVFATHSQSVGTHLAIRHQHYRNLSAAVGSRFIVPAYTYSPRIRNPFEMPSRNVRNVFVICVLHIRRVKVWFLRHKSMVFGVQKPPFYIAKTPFLACKKWVFAKP